MKIRFGIIFSILVSWGVQRSAGLSCFDCTYYEGILEYDHQSGGKNQCNNFRMPQPSNKPTPNDTDITVKAVLCPPDHPSCKLEIGIHKTKKTRIVIRGCSNVTFVGCRDCGNGVVDECGAAKSNEMTGRRSKYNPKLSRKIDAELSEVAVVHPEEDIEREHQCFCRTDRCNGQPPVTGSQIFLVLAPSALGTLFLFLNGN